MATITLNHLFHNGEAVGKVGDGGTVLMYSDTHPVTVIGRTPKSITVREDAHDVIGGQWPDFQYSYRPNPQGRIWTYRWSDKKGWINRKSGTRLLVGERRYYYDPTF